MRRRKCQRDDRLGKEGTLRTIAQYNQHTHHKYIQFRRNIQPIFGGPARRGIRQRPQDAPIRPRSCHPTQHSGTAHTHTRTWTYPHAHAMRASADARGHAHTIIHTPHNAMHTTPHHTRHHTTPHHTHPTHRPTRLRSSRRAITTHDTILGASFRQFSQPDEVLRQRPQDAPFGCSHPTQAPFGHACLKRRVHWRVATTPTLTKRPAVLGSSIQRTEGRSIAVECQHREESSCTTLACYTRQNVLVRCRWSTVCAVYACVDRDQKKTHAGVSNSRKLREKMKKMSAGGVQVRTWGVEKNHSFF